MAAKKKKPTEEELASPRTAEQFQLSLRRTTRLFYDIQAMRLQAQGRLLKKSPKNPIELHPRDLARLSSRVHELEIAEANALKDLDEHLHEVPFYAKVIEPQRSGKYRGLGPRMASIIVSSFDIHREETVSQMWAFAGLAPVPARRCRTCSTLVESVNSTDSGPATLYSHPRPPKPKPKGEENYGPREPARRKCPHDGLDIGEVETFASGRAMKPTKGQKLPYNAWLRTKLVGVLSEVLIKLGTNRCSLCNELTARRTAGVTEGEVWHRDETVACERAKRKLEPNEIVRTETSPYAKFYYDYKARKTSEGWGTSDGHRHWAAKRYLIKMLLLDIWKEWRAFEGLTVRPPYQEEYLGHVHRQAPIKRDEPAPEMTEDRVLEEALIQEALDDEYTVDDRRGDEGDLEPAPDQGD